MDNYKENMAIPELIKLIDGLISGRYVLRESRRSNQILNDQKIMHFDFDVQEKPPKEAKN
ncbi:MAG: hypothetical protein ABF723_02150 [Lentilactobacillus hilgardii]|uniref:hypothetical protein n=1 Tax=Lactobacillaceae TaxID=33958 RepID=UPI001CC21781|nr:hypothetical protein [Lentilactobacillus hilgardii]MBZ2200544.1 hypothetical protein [Lentilactobacillus hilgardii]MBZ2204580.1 hypothetical protein [Lentilactobacillus hilgardii]